MQNILKDWIGTWQQGDGYWLRIDVVDDQVVLERSGDTGSVLTFKYMDNDARTLTYEEAIEDRLFTHTLTRLSTSTIEDDWLDMKTGIVWKSETLFSDIPPDETVTVDIVNEQADHDYQLIFNQPQFSDHQHRLTEELAKAIFDELNTTLDDVDLVDELTDKIGFAVCSILDASQHMEVEGRTLRPNITFITDMDKRQILASDKGSWMHEYIIGFADEFRESMED